MELLTHPSRVGQPPAELQEAAGAQAGPGSRRRRTATRRKGINLINLCINRLGILRGDNGAGAHCSDDYDEEIKGGPRFHTVTA